METQRLSMGNLAVMMAIASVIWTTAYAGKNMIRSMLGWTLRLIIFGLLFTLMGHFNYMYVKANTCCEKVSKNEVTDPIIGYRLQKLHLPCVKAVILETPRGKFCISPRAPWVREKLLQFKKAQKDKLIPSAQSNM
ncbi:uncharacterized protein [Paramisgurnus dabryanus]|uniref:uncharacterized protein n=1 Tax=Paramisgurnus dabryanus TaxID=90735 RepID=UPI003CCF0208